MRNRTRMIAAAAAVTTALAAGSTAAVASATGAKPGPPAKTMSASEKPGHDAIVAAVAEELHVSMARVGAALQPLFAAGHGDPSSSAFAAAARSLGVSTQQLSAALMQAKQSLAGGPHAKQSPGGSKTAEERPGRAVPAPRPVDDNLGHPDSQASLTGTLRYRIAVMSTTSGPGDPARIPPAVR